MPTPTSLTTCDLSPSTATADLAPLFEGYLSRQVLAFRNVIEESRLRNFCLERAVRTLRHKNANVIVQEGANRVAALACWTTLPWDSEMYGFQAARLDFLLAEGNAPFEKSRRLLAEALEQAGSRGVRHMIARVDAGDLSTICALERSGFELIDGIQTFTRSLPAHVETPGCIETRLFQEQDLPQVREIARRSYIYDRFHADAAIDTATADRINEEWLVNSCNGKIADATVVGVDGAAVLGYATCKIDCETREGVGLAIGSIVMVATERRARNKGVAMACTHAAIRWFEEANVQLVQVGTQLRNIPAARLYEKCGFGLTANTLTLRKILQAPYK